MTELTMGPWRTGRRSLPFESCSLNRRAGAATCRLGMRAARNPVACRLTYLGLQSRCAPGISSGYRL